MAIKSLLASAAASAFSFCAIAAQSFFLVWTTSASLSRATVAECARRKFAARHVVMAMLTMATARPLGYHLSSDGGAVVRKSAARIPVKCIAATPVVAITENSSCWPSRSSIDAIKIQPTTQTTQLIRAETSTQMTSSLQYPFGTFNAIMPT